MNERTNERTNERRNERTSVFRIKSLERNVSLSTGFLEELSLKYIKQIDELNTAVKERNNYTDRRRYLVPIITGYFIFREGFYI